MAPLLASTFPVSAVQQFLDRQAGVRRPRLEEAIFDVSTPFGSVPVRIGFVAEEDLITISAFAQDRVPPARLADAQSLIARFNFEAPGASWLVLDGEDGEVSARAALPLARRMATESMIAELVDAAVDLVGEAIPFLPGIPLAQEIPIPTRRPSTGELN
jgi:hypothetical protein